MPFLFDHRPSEQEVFDEACRYFATTAGPSLKPRAPEQGVAHFCMYRSPTGGCCVAGHFIPDGPHTGVFDAADASSISAIIRSFPDDVPSWFPAHSRLLLHLQEIHDDQSNWEHCDGAETWKHQAVRLAMSDLARQRFLMDTAVTQIGAVPA
jgi:hypothetical protein